MSRTCVLMANDIGLQVAHAEALDEHARRTAGAKP